MKVVEHVLPEGGVVDEGLARHAVAADHQARRVVQAGLVGRAALQLDRADLARRRHHAGVGVEPEAVLQAGLGAAHAKLGREDHAVVGKRRLDEGRRLELAADLAREHGFEILAPAAGHHDVADMQGRIDAAGDAAHHDAGDVEPVERELGGHRGVDHADAAQEQHDGGRRACR